MGDAQRGKKTTNKVVTGVGQGMIRQPQETRGGTEGRRQIRQEGESNEEACGREKRKERENKLREKKKKGKKNTIWKFSRTEHQKTPTKEKTERQCLMGGKEGSIGGYRARGVKNWTGIRNDEKKRGRQAGRNLTP